MTSVTNYILSKVSYFNQIRQSAYERIILSKPFTAVQKSKIQEIFMNNESLLLCLLGYIIILIIHIHFDILNSITQF